METALKVLHSTWGVEIEGHSTDLSNLEQKVNGSIQSADDYFISKAGDMLILRTSRWDTASDFGEVSRIAELDLSVLRNCIDALDTCGPLNIGTVFKFLAAGKVDRNRETSFNLRVFKSEAEYASPEKFKTTLQAARSDPKLQIAVSELNSIGGGWFSIFKAFEALKRYYGDEARFFKRFPSEKTQIELMRRTANSFRHAGGVFAPINEPMKLETAYQLIRKLLSETLEAQAKAPTQVPPSFGVPNLQVAQGESIGLKPLTAENIQPGYDVAPSPPPS